MKIETDVTTMIEYFECKDGFEIDIDPRLWIDYRESVKKVKQLQAKLEKKI